MFCRVNELSMLLWFKFNVTTLLYGWIIALLLCNDVCIYGESDIVKNITRLHNINALKAPVLEPGVLGLVPKVAIHGAVVVSYRGNKSNKERGIETLKMVSGRMRNVAKLKSELPFGLTEWPSVFTKACPLYPHGHPTERGLSWAHRRIWSDFVHFSAEVLDALEEMKVNGTSLNKTEPIISKDGLYKADEDRRLYKNNIPFLDDDIIVIFEDDADSIIEHTNETILEELSVMNTDLLYLGWCDGRMARPVPLCTHAYALTRKGARKMLQVWEPCGRALDEQFVIMVKNNFLTFRTANPWSFKAMRPPYPIHGDKNFGIFHQRKSDLGSLNGN